MTKARTNADNASADIQGVTAGTGLTGGGTSGTVTLTNDMATAIAAKGDLIVGTGNDTYSVLTAAENGSTIVADSSTSTGLRYTAGTVQSNPVLNSSFQVAQRGTSFSASNSAATSYWLDRWSMYFGTTTGYTLSQQSVSDSTNLPNIQYCARIARANATTGTNGGTIGQSIEILNSVPFAGKPITLSFYARKGALYSGTTITATLKSGTGTSDANGIYNTYTGQATVATTSPTLTTTWVRYSVTGTVGSTATQLALAIDSAHTGTSGATDYYEITGLQIDIGSVALPFRTYAATIQGELAACQRYYIRQGGELAFQMLGWGQAFATTSITASVSLPVKMRVLPTSVDFSNLRWTNQSTGAAITAVTLDANLNSSYQPTINGTTTGIVIGNVYSIGGNNSINNYLGFSAEL